MGFPIFLLVFCGGNFSKKYSVFAAIVKRTWELKLFYSFWQCDSHLFHGWGREDMEIFPLLIMKLYSHKSLPLWERDKKKILKTKQNKTKQNKQTNKLYSTFAIVGVQKIWEFPNFLPTSNFEIIFPPVTVTLEMQINK